MYVPTDIPSPPSLQPAKAGLNLNPQLLTGFTPLFGVRVKWAVNKQT